MKALTLFLLGMVGILCVASGQARMSDFAAHEAVMDSLSQVHPRLRGRWLNERGLEMPGINAPLPASPLSDSGGLRLVGKWGRGPSVAVTGRDSLVFLSLGSQVAIINFADPDNPEVLSEPQATGLVTQAAVRDSFLYIGARTGQAGIEVWNIADPRNPVLRSRTPTLLSDFCVRDTFLYLTQAFSGPNDTFNIYSIANPENLRLLGACRDSGDAVTVTNNAAFLADRWGLYALDVSDPANPRRVGSYPGVPISVEARGSILCVSFMDPNRPDWLRFEILDVSSPATPRRLGHLDDAGGYDIFLAEDLAFLSGYYTGGHEFRIVDITDSTRPRIISSTPTPGEGWGCWVNLMTGFAFVADRIEGVSLIDIDDITRPQILAAMLSAGHSEDVYLDGQLCYVANGRGGMKILDISNAMLPVQTGEVVRVSHAWCRTVTARDSFAYLSWTANPYFRSVDVSDPVNPVLAGGCYPPVREARHMVLRDSLIYAALHYQLSVVNVARPREPRVVGEVRLPDRSYELVLKDSLAYIANGLGGLILVNVADPETLTTISNLTFPNPAIGVAVKDSFAYVGAKHLRIVNVARPDSPSVVDTVPLSIYGGAIEIDDTLLYVGTRVGYSGDLRLFSIADPVRPQQVGFYQTPLSVNRVVVEEPYIYLSCSDAGVVILEVIPTGITEPDRHGDGFRPRVLRAAPNPTRGVVHVNLPPGQGPANQIQVYNSAGRRVLACAGKEVKSRIEVDLGELPPGLYFLELKAATETHRGKIVVQKE